ncbi:hypothetical protein LCGC14_2596310, partial [marine sediment metagenome]
MFSRIKSMFAIARQAYNETRSTVVDDDPRLWSGFNQWDTSAGVKIDHNTALSMAAVFSCVKVLSEGIAQLPLFLMRTDGTGNDKKQRATEHPLYDILHNKPNPIQTSYQFRQMLMAHLVLRGNAFAEIQRKRSGEIMAL